MRINIAILSFVCALIFPNMVFAACIDWLGKMVLHAAWVSPTYKKCEITADGFFSGVRRITIKTVGDSHFKIEGEVWVEAVVELDRENNVKNIHWGKYSAIAPPSTAYSLLK